MLATIKAKPDTLIEKKRAAAVAGATKRLTDEYKLNLEVLKGSFLEALGEDAVYEIQQQNRKDKLYQQDIAWIKTKLEACYKATKNTAESLVKLWNGTRPKDKTTLQHWIEVGEKVAHCKLAQMKAKDIEDHIHIAAFLSTVNDPKQAKAYWEKKTNQATLAEYIRATAEADKEMRRVQQPSTKPEEDKTETDPKEKVKDEPVGKVERRKPKDKSKHRKLKTERQNVQNKARQKRESTKS